MCQVHPEKEQTKHKTNYGNRERETEDDENENQDLETENANLEKENEELKKEVEGRMNRKDKKTSLFLHIFFACLERHSPIRSLHFCSL
jgi:hypothetical protein